MKTKPIFFNYIFTALCMLGAVTCWSHESIDTTHISQIYTKAESYRDSDQLEEAIRITLNGLPKAQQANHLVAEFYQLLFQIYVALGDTDLAAENMLFAIDYYEKNGKTLEQLQALDKLSKFYSENALLVKEEETLNEGLCIAKGIKDSVRIFDFRSRIGLSNYHRGEYGDAQQYFMENAKGLEYADGFDVQKIRNLRSIGVIHFSMKQHEKALSFFEKSIALGLEKDLKSEILIAYYNTGLIYSNIDKLDLAESSLNKGLKLAKELNDEQEIAYINLILTNLFYLQKEYDKAEKAGKHAYNYFKKNNIPSDLGQVNRLLGDVYFETNKIELAFMYYKKAEKIFNKGDNSHLKSELYTQLSQAYSTVGDFEAAYQYQNKSIEIEFNISAKEKEEEVLALQTKYESEFQAKEQSLKIEALQKEGVLKNQQFYLSLIVGFLLFLLSLVLWIYNRIKIKRNAELIEAKIFAENAAKAKSEFLATMSHEIRTPLNGVVGMVNLLQDENPTPKQKEYLDILKFSSDGLLSLVNDILDFAKFESGHIQLEKNSFDLKDNCLKAFSAHCNAVDEDKVKMKLNVQLDNVKHFVIGDQFRLNQVLTNLVSNATKFTDKGSVELKATMIEQSADSAKIRFSVTDTGIGISKDKQLTIFEKYTQASSNTARLYGGTGLGLNISKEIVDLYDSELKLESELGKGSRFYFDIEFPLDKSLQVASSPISSSNEHFCNTKNLHRMKILLAEDNKVNQIVSKRILEKWNVDLTIAADGQIAVDLFKTNEFDLILMDIQMPNLDGVEATQIIRTLPNGDLPIFSMTASTLSAELREEYDKLMDGHIGKPFNPDTLYETLTTYASRLNLRGTN